MRSPGFVYVMVDPHAPQFVSVGRSDGPPEDRAQAASMELRDAAYFSDAISAEGFVQDSLESFRADHADDVFEVPVEIALKALSDATLRYVGTRASVASSVSANAGGASLRESTPGIADPAAAAALYDQAVLARASKDAAGALHMFQKSARLGETRAYLALAEMTERGEGCRADEARAIEWLAEGTRRDARECWGALADRRPQVETFRAYFDGAALGSLTAEQRMVVHKRLRGYMLQIVNNPQPEDAHVIDRALHNFDSDELSREWQRMRKGKGGAKKSSMVLTWVVALSIAGVIGLVLPNVLLHYLPHAGEAAEETGEPPADKADKAEKEKPVKPAAGAVAVAAAAKAKAAKLKKMEAARAPVVTDPKPKEQGDDSTLGMLTRALSPSAHPEPPGAAKPAPRRPSETRGVQGMSGDELRELFNWGKEKQDSFRNSVVRVTDKVVKVGKRDIAFKGIKCKLDDEAPEGITSGSSVTVEGVIRGKGFWTGTITLDSCRVR